MELNGKKTKELRISFSDHNFHTERYGRPIFSCADRENPCSRHTVRPVSAGVLGIAIELNVRNIRNCKSGIFQLKHVMSNVFSTYIFEMVYNSKK